MSEDLNENNEEVVKDEVIEETTENTTEEVVEENVETETTAEDTVEETEDEEVTVTVTAEDFSIEAGGSTIDVKEEGIFINDELVSNPTKLYNTLMLMRETLNDE